MISEGDIKVNIQSMRTKWKTWAGFGIQVRQGSTNTVPLTSGVGHLGRLHSSNKAKDKAKLIKNTSYIPYIQTVSIV